MNFLIVVSNHNNNNLFSYTQQSAKLINYPKDKFKVVYTTDKNIGPLLEENKDWANTIGFLRSGDELRPNSLLQLALAFSNPYIGVCYFNIEVDNKTLALNYIDYCVPFDMHNDLGYLQERVTFFRKEVLFQFGFNFPLLAQHCIIHHIPLTLGKQVIT